MEQIDFEVLLTVIKGSKWEPSFKKIAELENYTRLFAPYELPDLKELVGDAQKALGAKLPRDYCQLLQCVDGGWLFTTWMFSIYDPEDEDNDLVSVNLYLWENSLIPDDLLAIAQADFGDYVCIRRDGSSDEVTLWNPEENESSDEDPNLPTWLETEIDRAKYLMNEDLLPELGDEEEEEDEE